ncbi:pentatricopeptide repeat-containing protein At4g02750-like [Selaginella moellendorffii]|uniref:pentatricopeptide repeat-containing protein At4g02750-like n=1 Tax=Selaginella moellendorffii TaxID=88036 RepID=UPI000D1C8285|nr:pentatricopeptide repeat-containing protein At4g02750-like [Selaginella moellendorffii]|eukprot:XP_024540231.1 pentatricopeptide repeat-containing protein At4g02750-like [Selaginella moellendorffii]
MPLLDMVSWNGILASYAREGLIPAMEEIFALMPGRNLISWTCVLNAYAQIGYIREAERIFEAMPERNLVSWTCMVTAYVVVMDLSNAIQVFNVMPEWNLVCFNAMLGAHIHMGVFSQMQAFFKEMPEADLISWVSILTICVRENDLVKAIEVYDKMPQRNLVAMNVMLSGYAESGDVGKAKSFFDQMPAHSNVSLTLMLNLYTQTGNLEAAKDFFDKILPKDIISNNSMLSAFACSGHLEESERMFYSLPEWSLASWNIFLAGYTQSGKLEHTRKLFLNMPDHSQVSWNILLAANAATGHLFQLKSLFDTMPDTDAASWTTLLATYVQSDRSIAADVYGQMKMLFSPDDVSIVSALIACGHGGKVQQGRDCFVSMSLDFGLVPSKQHYCCMIDLLARSGRLDSAIDLAESMPFEASRIELMCLVGACGSQREIRRGGEASKIALEFNPGDGRAMIWRPKTVTMQYMVLFSHRMVLLPVRTGVFNSGKDSRNMPTIGRGIPEAGCGGDHPRTVLLHYQARHLNKERISVMPPRKLENLFLGWSLDPSEKVGELVANLVVPKLVASERLIQRVFDDTIDLVWKKPRLEESLSLGTKD